MDAVEWELKKARHRLASGLYRTVSDRLMKQPSLVKSIYRAAESGVIVLVLVALVFALRWLARA